MHPSIHTPYITSYKSKHKSYMTRYSTFFIAVLYRDAIGWIAGR